MTTTDATATTVHDDVQAAVPAAIALAQCWVRATEENETPAEKASTGQLAALVHDPDGVEFTMRFVDRVARPSDDKVAARELRRLAMPSGEPGSVPVPAFLGGIDKGLMMLGAVAAPIAPRLVMPLARRRLRQLVGHLVLDASDRALTKRLAIAREEGVQLNLNLLGEAVLGEDEADKRLARTAALLARPDVDYVSVKASSVASQLNPWDLDGSRDRLVERLTPLYRQAQARPVPAFINLDMEEYKDLHLTVDVFTTLLSDPALLHFSGGIVLQAYLPDATGALERLAEFAVARRDAGGAPIKVRLVKGANLAMEHVDAELHDWEQAPFTSKPGTDASYVRLLDLALRPELAGALRVGVASHNLFHVALAHELATARGVGEQMDVEMLQGMAPAQARAVRDVVGGLILYTPVVHAGDFDVAVSYLVRRLEENAASENYLYALFSPEPSALVEQESAFRDSVRDRNAVEDSARRTQDRTAEPAPFPARFENTPDTDPSLPANRTWAAAAIAAEPAPVRVPELTEVAAVDEVVAGALAAATGWAATPAAERAAVLRACADALEAARGELVTVMVHEAGKTVAEADPEISEAIDFARYYAEQALLLDADADASFAPHRVVVVTPPWNFPVAIPLGGVLAGLAAGSSVIIKPAPQTRACAEVGVAALQAGGIPADVLQLVHTDEADAGPRLITHPDVDAVILTGATETAALFRSWRPELRLLAETSGKNALIVTPSADPDLAVADLLRSAFGHAGQKCSAASLVICVGSVATDERFRRQLVDAVRSLAVGYGTDLGTTMGPLQEPAQGKLERALTTLEPGERWLVEPRQLDDTGRSWSPGLRDGVAPGSWFHQTECFGPVLGIMTAATLDEAIDLQNATRYGLTGGIHSLDEGEVAHWLERVEVGNAYVNRHITGAIVQRQSFGGWKGSTVGPGAKAGGPGYVPQLGTWTDRVELDDLGDAAWLAAGRASDAVALAERFGIEHDPSDLRSEANVLRYRALPELAVVVGDGSPARELPRVRAAAAAAGVPVRVLRGNVPAQVSGLATGTRLRVLGDLDPAVAEAAAKAGVSLLDAVPVVSGARELSTVFREQAISRTRHRFGHLPPAA